MLYIESFKYTTILLIIYQVFLDIYKNGHTKTANDNICPCANISNGDASAEKHWVYL